MEVKCEFSLTKWNIEKERRYTCKITSQTIPESAELKFVGCHKTNKTNADVEAIWFESCDMPKFPRGLTKTFPNLQSIQFSASNLKEVRNDDLIEFKNLTLIDLRANLIEFLPADLFKGLEETLEWVNFFNNKLKVIEPTILDGFKAGNLKHVNFKENPNYTKYYSTLYPNLSNATLDMLKNELFEKYYSNIQIVRKLMNEKSELADKVKKLETENQLMKRQSDKQNEKFQMENGNLLKQIQKLNESFETEVLKHEDEKRGWEETKAKLMDVFSKLEKNVKDLNEAKENLENSIEILSNQAANLEAEKRSKLQVDLSEFAKENASLKDFTVIVQGKEFQVHKFVIAARCPAFAEMLKNNPEAKDLNLADICDKSFVHILIFLYTQELPKASDDIDFVDLFSAAGRLEVEELKNFSAMKLMELVDGENALEVLKLSIKYGFDELGKKSFEEIKKKHHACKFKDEWSTYVERLEKAINFAKKKEQIEKELEEEYEFL